MQMNLYLSFKGDCEAAFKFYEQCLGGQPRTIFLRGHAHGGSGPGEGVLRPTRRSLVRIHRGRQRDAMLSS
jgi:uncharacterized glyoxalase superfamily protein PhnB